MLKYNGGLLTPIQENFIIEGLKIAIDFTMNIITSIFEKILGGIYGRLRSAYYNNRYSEFRKVYNISHKFKFQGTDVRLYGEGEINLGQNSYIGTNSSMQSGKGYKIEVGFNCQISHNVRIYTVSADPNQDFKINKIEPNVAGNVIIGDGVWIGANVFINPGVTIGSNSVVGANSVITINVEENSIVGGVPARVLKYKDVEE